MVEIATASTHLNTSQYVLWINLYGQVSVSVAVQGLLTLGFECK